MLLRQTLSDLVIATWDVDPQRVAEALPAGLAPQLAGGRALVSAVGFRAVDVRLGRVPLPGWSQVAVRTYVTCPARDEAGVYLWLARASFPGGAGAAFGLPLRTTLVRVDATGFEAPGVGLALRCRPVPGPPDLPDTEPRPGEHDIAFYPRWGNPKRVGRLVARHAPIRWRQAEVEGEPRLDPVLALGFDAGRPRWCVAAEATVFEAVLPPRAVRL